MKRDIQRIPAQAIARLTEYHWPGNVRELENLIERAVILSRGAELEIPLGALAQGRQFPVINSVSDSITLEEAQRRHIVGALKGTNWVIGGPAGAAARLGTKRSTLQYRMKKLGIARSG